jgi:hypothetical protein
MVHPEYNPFTRGETSEFKLRRQMLIDRLLKDLGSARHYEADPEKGRCTLSNRRYSLAYQARLQHYHLCLLHCMDAEAANHYYETSEDLDSRLWNRPRNEPDWKLLPLTRLYYQCHQLLSPPARARLEAVLREGRNEIVFGGTENHIINRAALVHLIDGKIGIRDAKTDRAEYIIRNWIDQRARYGVFEYNSPTYHRHSILPLIELHDLSPALDIVEAALQLLDVCFGIIAITTLNGVRGGPYHRVTRVEEYHFKGDDVTALISHLFFGAHSLPGIITEGATWATTTYRPLNGFCEWANHPDARGSYEVRQQVDSVQPKLNAIQWITPRYILASFTDRPPYKCHYYGSTNCSNLHPWELTFGQDSGSIGPSRSREDVSDFDNPNSSLWQHENALFFYGSWELYGDADFTVLALNEQGRKVWVVLPSESSDLPSCGIIQDNLSGLSALEVIDGPGGMDPETLLAQMSQVRWAPQLTAAGFSFEYTTRKGTSLRYDCGSAWVGGSPVPVRDYPTIDSPFIRSAWASGEFSFLFAGEELHTPFSSEAPGWGPGLTAVYQFGDKVLERVDRTLDYNWGTGMPDPSIPSGPFTVEWTGFFRAPYDGEVDFEILCSGPLRFELDGRTIINQQDPVAQSRSLVGKFSTTAQAVYPIRIHLAHHTGPSCLVARHRSQHEGWQALGLTGELFPLLDPGMITT